MVIHSPTATHGRLSCQVPDYNVEILKFAAKNKDKLYIEFIQKFLSYIPIDYSFGDRQALFNDFVLEAFEFYKQRAKKQKIQLRINHTTIDNDPAINVLVLMDDRPYVIDSVVCLLTNLHLQAKFLLHPVITANRSNSGELQKILNDRGEDGHTESLIHMSILGNFDKQAIHDLEGQLRSVLEQLEFSRNSASALLKRVESISEHITQVGELDKSQSLHHGEIVDFLSWLRQDNFIFLGISDFDIKSQVLVSEEGMKKIWQDSKNEINYIIQCSQGAAHEKQLIILGKINTPSFIQSGNLVDYILVKKINQHGVYESGSIIFGMYNPVIRYSSVSNIPLLRQKLNYVLNKSDFSPAGHNANKLKIIIESLPKEALIQIKEGDLYCMCLHMLSSMMSKKLKLFIQYDWSSSFINIIIFLPRERLTSEIHNMIDCYLSDKFGSKILSNHITEVAEEFAYLFVTLEAHDKHSIDMIESAIEMDLERISIRWSEDFYHRLSKKFGEYQGGINFKIFDAIFPADYRQKFSPETALIDIEYLQKAVDAQKMMFNLEIINDLKCSLKIYSPAVQLVLSDILPSVENLGFKAVDEQSFAIKEIGDVKESWIYYFDLTGLTAFKGDVATLKLNVEEVLDKMATGVLANDSLSKLIVLADLNWHQVKLLKGLTRYLHQTGFAYGKGYVQLTLIKHPEYTKMLVALFDTKFNPVYSPDVRTKNIKKITTGIHNYLAAISISSEDKVLRMMFDIIEAIVRTNCYQPILHNSDSQQLLKKDYLSFKFDSTKVPGLPMPVPFAEIFVYAKAFEAIHLRGGKVARGGIRWSDRAEDYRVEVLSLMKAQMAKNAVIVPVGSKGGFIVSFTDGGLSRDEYMAKVVECYKNFLRGMLDITDNIVKGKVRHPENTIIYDEEDPYLVVAADKGTAAFSDYANGVSEEYGYWLGDAFASGGSAGYDHKKMAITSKGAWISVSQHFALIGIDVQKDPITVVGIGDMSGDVFGNGMLRSNTIKLLAAFNHKHIFVDPSPDPILSFNERRRLFKLPYSSWSDYDPKLISQGGGVFERSSKLLKLSAEIRALLQISSNAVSPEELIRAILKADVDLLWNGGIGTYIKAETENNVDIGDKVNDLLRCDGKEIRAKVIGEGGNVGVSQQGRVEYSKHGGRINTDFIDNSSGVDCSDHEVNIKIALRSALSSNKLTLAQRNKLLFDMTGQVEELVLRDNYDQGQAITIMQLSPALTMSMFGKFLDTLEEEKMVVRSTEFLPTAEEISKRTIAHESMTRPELCILLSYSKRSVCQALMDTSFSNDKYFESHLINYFPQLMQKEFRSEILSHPLKHEIIRTSVTNKIINQLGGVFLNVVKHETNAAICDIVRSYTMICEIFDLNTLWYAVESLPTSIDSSVKIDMFTEIGKVMRRGVTWFLKHAQHPIDVSKTIGVFFEPAKSLGKVIGKLLLGEARAKYDDKVNYYIASKVEKSLAIRVATLDSMVSVCDIINISSQTKAANKDVANLYFTVGQKFSIDWLRRSCDKLVNDSDWNRLSIQSLRDDFYDKQRRVLIKILRNTHTTIDFNEWVYHNRDYMHNFLTFLTDIRAQEHVDLYMIILANKEFDMFLRKLE